MSDIGREAHIRRPVTQLPVTAYFSRQLHDLELRKLFKAGHGYRGHELMVPEVGDYYALPAEGEGRILVRHAGEAPAREAGNAPDDGRALVAKTWVEWREAADVAR